MYIVIEPITLPKIMQKLMEKKNQRIGSVQIIQSVDFFSYSKNRWTGLIVNRFFEIKAPKFDMMLLFTYETNPVHRF